MFRWFARLLLFRLLPARVMPVLTIVEVAMLLRGVRRGWQAAGRRRAADVEQRQATATKPGARVGR